MNGYHHLTESERNVIEHMRQAGHTLQQIGKAIGFNPSSIQRELRRNCTRQGYRATAAHQESCQRQRQASSRPRIDPAVWQRVRHLLLSVQAGPKQIACLLPISHEIIYRQLYRWIASGEMIFADCLRSKRVSRLRWRTRRLAEAIRIRRPMSERSDEGNARTQLGHYEADLIVSGGWQPTALLVITERQTGATLIRKVKAKDSKTVCHALIKALLPLKSWVNSITTDNGSEFVRWSEVEAALDCYMYASKPRRPWLRAIVEHTNGLIRQYFTKGSDAALLTAAAISQIQFRLNHRPRIRLQGRTPYQVFLSITGVALHC